MAITFSRVELGPNDDGRRLDRIIRKILPELPLSRIYRALRSREIRVNGGRGRPELRVHEHDTLEIASYLGRPGRGDTDPPIVAPGTLEGRILHGSGDILAINKRRGELVHGPGSLEDLVRAHCAASVAAGGVSFRPGPIHRLDRNTSGCILYAISTEGARRGADALAAGTLEKYYLAVLDGVLEPGPGKEPIVWEESLRRDENRRVTLVRPSEDPSALSARTLVHPIVTTSDRRTIVFVRIETGRTHQIRAHAASHGHPVAGDRKYGSVTSGPSLLHAWILRSTDGALGFERLEAPPPSMLLRLLDDALPGGAEVLHSIGHELLPPL